MPKPGFSPGKRPHTHTIELPAHLHGGVTSGTVNTASTTIPTVTTSAEKG